MGSELALEETQRAEECEHTVCNGSIPGVGVGGQCLGFTAPVPFSVGQALLQ